MSRLESDLNAVEQDLSAFIKSQKKSLMKDKEELVKKMASPRESQTTSHPSQVKEHIESNGTRSERIKSLQDGNGLSLNLGGYADKQKQLRNQRQEEYKKYLAEQETRAHGKTTQSYANRNEVAQRYNEQKEFKSAVDKEYEDLLKKKKVEENAYRVQFDEPNLKGVSGKKVIEFDSDDEELFQYVSRQKKKKRRKSAEPEFQRSDISNLKKGVVFDGRAYSVPPSLPTVFGGSSHSALNKERNQQYKKELEEQIKEKELVKTRDKLRRLGRITSSTDMSEIEATANNRWVTPKVEKLAENKDQASQMSDRGGSNNNFPNNMINPFNMYMNQNGMQNGMFNPMMMNPMNNPMNNIGWPNYNMMAGAVGFQPDQMMGFQQIQNGMQQMDLNASGNRKQWVTPEKKRHLGVPSLALDDSPQEQGYVPTTIENSKPYTQPPGGKSHGLFGQTSSEDNVSARRMKQLTYQQELKKQMDEKKAQQEKEKAECERYERKLEQEIVTYDPWGKGGAGAPVRNRDGEIVADLRKIRNNPADTSPRFDSPGGKNISLEEPSPLIRALEESQNNNMKPPFYERSPEVKFNESPGDKLTKKVGATYSRGAALKELQGVTAKSPRGISEQEEYKEFLQEQVEQKNREKEAQNERQRIEQEKEHKKYLDQIETMKMECERDKLKQREKERQIKEENEKLRLLAEEKRYQEEMKQKKIQEEMQADIRREAEERLNQKTLQKEENSSTMQRTNSPPVPAVVKEIRKRSLESDGEIKRYNQSINEDDDIKMEYLNQIRSSMEQQERQAKHQSQQQNHIVQQLAAMRKQLQKQERTVQNELEKNKSKYKVLLSNPESKVSRQAKDIFERATRKSAGKKRINSDNNHEIRRDTSSPYFSSDSESKDLDSQQREYMRQQELRLKALRQNMENKSAISRLQPEFQSEGSKQSLLDSDSKFISVENHAEIKSKERDSSARARRRQKDKDFTEYFESFKKDTTDTASVTTFAVENIAQKNDKRLRHLKGSDNSVEMNEEIIKDFMDNSHKESSKTSLQADTYLTNIK